jgi:uncharacterized RDD family membrane protein YckC
VTEYRYGGFWRRVGAILTDKLILYIILMIFVLAGAVALRLSLPASQFRLLTGGFMETSGYYLIVYYAATALISMVYFTYFHGTSGQTPGKIIFGLRVIQTTGEDMTLGVAFLRSVGYIISGMFLYLGFLWVAFDGKKQGWHDKIAATVVILTRNEPTFQKTEPLHEEHEEDEKYLDKENDVL